MARLYRRLAIFPEDAHVPCSVLTQLWQVKDTTRIVRALKDRSLVFVDADGCVHLHDLQRDCLRVDAGEEALPAMNGALVDAYGEQCGDAGVPGLSRAWWALPGGSYMLDHLCFHLAEAGRVGEARRVGRGPVVQVCVYCRAGSEVCVCRPRCRGCVCGW